jgi:cleavage stimulation factor subunit 2
VRNLQEVPVSGRTLRVELSTDEPIQRKDGRRAPPGGGTNGVRGTPAGVPPGGARYMERDGAGSSAGGGGGGGGVNLAALPPGQDVPPGVKATDVITKTLASIPPGKLEEVLMQMKVRTRPTAS